MLIKDERSSLITCTCSRRSSEITLSIVKSIPAYLQNTRTTYLSWPADRCRWLLYDWTRAGIWLSCRQKRDSNTTLNHRSARRRFRATSRSPVSAKTFCGTWQYPVASL